MTTPRQLSLSGRASGYQPGASGSGTSLRAILPRQRLPCNHSLPGQQSDALAYTGGATTLAYRSRPATRGLPQSARSVSLGPRKGAGASLNEASSGKSPKGSCRTIVYGGNPCGQSNRRVMAAKQYIEYWDHLRAGDKYGRLTILQTRVGGSAFVHVSCSCGNEAVLYPCRLVNHGSCGCLDKRHGQSNTRTYKSWRLMINRCLNKSDPRYSSYGGRGIQVCDRWRIYQEFLFDMGERPDGRTLDRIDNNGNYEPGNCRWATNKQQARNRRTTRTITANGRTMSIAAWSEALGISPTTLCYRIDSGMSNHDAVNNPINGTRRPRGSVMYRARRASH